MKTAEEILKENHSIIKAMKIYANQKIDEASDCYEYDINEGKFILNKQLILSLKDEL